MAKRRVGRPVEPFELTAEEKETLERWARGRTVSQALARRSRIVLGCAAGRLCTEVAREQKTSIQTVSKWRQRFVDRRLDGMADTPHPNVHRKLADDRVEELVRATLQELPKGATHWSTRKLAKRVGVSQSSVSRVWRAFHLKPHRRRTFTLSNDEFFVEKVRDIVGLYLKAPSRKQLVRITKERWRTERVYEDLKGELGLDHYEGRSFRGWHHHVTVVLCCYAFVTSERLRHFPPSRGRARPRYSLDCAA